MAKDALEKLESLYGKANDSEKAIIDFLKVWIAEDESAAEKVTADNKTPKGAYNAMRDYARKKNAQGLHGKEAWVQVMKYYGEDENNGPLDALGARFVEAFRAAKLEKKKRLRVRVTA